ncbi:MAG: two pore domain potassium channel family protein [Flavobacteriaceae bacterium]|nr:two pore domain potassium channel family protein [Flavobacteriaceae bacterium]
MQSKLYKNRFTFFLISQLSIVFGSLIFPIALFEEKMMPILFLINIAVGILLIAKQKVLFWMYLIFFVSSLFIYGFDALQRNDFEDNIAFRFGVYFLFYVTVSVSIIKQVWNAKQVSRKVIIGLMSGYLSLGFIGFFMFSAIELYEPNSFSGLRIENNALVEKLDALLYYSYITMLTIGYGEISPVTPIAQKAAVLVGLIGQFYTVIITAVVVEKYIRHSVTDAK